MILFEIISLALVIGMTEAFTNSSSLVTRQDIIEYLTDEEKYDSTIVPDFNREEATNVQIQITMQDLHSISETSMDYSVDIFLRQKWRDERLDFSQNDTAFDKLELDPKNIGSVWHPDTYFRNEKKASVHKVTTSNELLHIHKNGTVLYSMRLAMTLTCAMLLQKYPFDSQTCPLYVESFGYTLDNIDLFWHDNDPFVTTEVEIPQFTLASDVVCKKTILHHQTGSFALLTATFTLHRKVGFYFLHVFAPSILLVVLSWVSFWVDPNAVPARVTLGVTCVLTMTTQSSGIRQTLPPVSYVKAIDVWMFVCLMFVFAALLEFAYVNVLSRRDRRKSTSCETEEGGDTQGVQNDAGRKKGVCNNKCWPKTKLPFFKDRKTMTAHEKAKQMDIISRFLFPITFVIFLVIFIMVSVLTPQPSIDSTIAAV